MKGAKRLGAALAEHVEALRGAGDSAYVLVEGVPRAVAEAMADAWPAEGLALAVASDRPERFGSRALGARSGTQLRNEPGSAGVCLVVCEGQRLPDRQSLNAFENLAPADLVGDADGLARMAAIAPAAELEGVARHVRSAIARLPAADRPGAPAIASYFDALAAGRGPLEALPELGAFRDDAQGSQSSDGRIRENLLLAGRRQSDELQRGGGLNDIRRRAEAVLARRGGSFQDAEREADRVMDLLQAGSDELLTALAFDEAREILERKQKAKLSELVLRELQDYRQRRQAESAQAGNDDAAEVPWQRYLESAGHLDSEENRQEAANELLGFDIAEERRCFQRGTRTKLERLLKDRVIKASNPSCPEAGLLAAARTLAGGLLRIELVSPEPERNPTPSRRNAARAIALACARLRLGGLLRVIADTFGIEVDPALLLDADGSLWDGVFADAELAAGQRLETVLLRMHGKGDVIVVEWRPDLDDVAVLRGALLLCEREGLSGRVDGAPVLAAFCAGAAPAVDPVPGALRPAARALRECARIVIQDGLTTDALDEWTGAWRSAAEQMKSSGDVAAAEELALAGTVRGAGSVAMTPWAPLKAEWLSQHLDALWTLLFLALHGDSRDEPLEDTAKGVAAATASHYPAYIRVTTSDRPLLPTSETRIWTTYGGPASESAQHGGPALRSVLQRLLRLQPEAAGHLRCAATGPGAADLLVREAAELVGTTVAGVEVGKVEVFCIDEGEDARPLPSTLAAVDERLTGVGRDRLELRYLPSLQEAVARLVPHGAIGPAVHLALVCGITSNAARLAIESPDVERPALTSEALFVPRTTLRPRASRRMLLAPPAATRTGLAWLELMHALDDQSWPQDGDPLRIPELRTVGADVAVPLRAAHDLALWVATIDPYATRDSLQSAMGPDVAILHQDRRLGGDSPLALVISQKSGGPADNAIGRSLQSARIVADRAAAVGIGVDLRRVAAQGYGILALEAATTGAGINELVGHVVAFSMLATRTTPWPLPPGCRLLLINLDDYKHWFPGKRADLLVLALDERDHGVHGAVIEVKARRSDESVAANDAIDQLRQTLQITRWAAYPDPETIHSRLWLNRIAEAATAVARESNIKLTAGELEALERFRYGEGTLEWAGIGLVFGPGLVELHRDRQFPLAGDLVPISVSAIDLTEPLLRSAAGTDLSELRTVTAERASLTGGRGRRRPEKGSAARNGAESPGPELVARPEPVAEPGPVAEPDPEGIAEPDAVPEPEPAPAAPDAPGGRGFAAPILGWRVDDGQPLMWHAAGEDPLPNGHMEVWGSSGAGKTQFVMALLSQLAAFSGTRFGIADFKNDYDGDFPKQAQAEFIDLWEGASYNPLALHSHEERDIRSAVIELRDIVDVATQSFTRMGVRQKAKLKTALEDAYSSGAASGAWPTLATLDALLDDDLRGIIGDLTGEPIFGPGRPLGDAIGENVVFALSRIPGNGLTTVLAAGFILSALQIRMQSLPQVANTVSYAVVVDEAHRVSSFKAVDTMIREGRSKGLAVLLATQQPGDLPEVVATNAQTKICFRLPDATVAGAAAKRLDPLDRELPEQIRTLGKGEAFVSLGGGAPRLLRMAQNYRDRSALDLPG